MKKIWIAATLFLQAATLCYGQAAYDLVLRNGTVIDGSGKKSFRADIGIRDGLIARVGNLRGARAGEVIDAKGLVVAPGFIDIHTHADGIAGSPLAENFVRMGVTTVVSGNCGGSAMPIGEALQKIREAGVAANFATLIGHNTVRRAVMGTEQRAPTAEELSRMKELVARAMSEGAVGLSTGLEYVPGTYAGADEIIELAREAARAGGLYASHMRNEGTEIEKSIAETIQVGETAGCPVHISHLKIDSPSRWGAGAAVVSMIEAARRRGLAVTADMYAYSAASSGLSIRFPAWALQGGEAQVRVRLEDPATWEKIQDEMMETLESRGFHDLSWAVIASYGADPSLEGLSIKDAAFRLKGEGSSAAQLEVAREMMLSGGASMVYHLMSEADIRRFMLYPHVSIASDSSLLTFGEGAPHPRGYGNNPRVLSYYVRQRKVLSLEEAIRRMTSLPAAQFGFEKRGLIREGFAADLVAFDRNRVQDRATYASPHQYPTGIGWVIVNGAPVVRDGSPTAARPGRVLRRSPAAR